MLVTGAEGHVPEANRRAGNEALRVERELVDGLEFVLRLVLEHRALEGADHQRRPNAALVPHSEGPAGSASGNLKAIGENIVDEPAIGERQIPRRLETDCRNGILN